MEDRHQTHVNRVDKLPHHNGTPIAKVSVNFRYHNNAGNGALKYDPVDVNSFPSGENTSFLAGANTSLDHIRSQRWNSSEKLLLKLIIKPRRVKDKESHKIMMVPSIGCPSELTNYEMIKQLLWVNSAYDRSTFLFVHNCEIENYLQEVGRLLRAVGVGLVAWECGQRVGFGLSRLAAQQYAMLYNPKRLRVVLCDVNVIAKKFHNRKLVINWELLDGYDTDVQYDSDAGYERPPKRRLLSAAGSGAGISSFEYVDSDTGYALKKRDNNPTFSEGRPLEQVITVHSSLQYDPRFITSSEDSNLQAAFLSHINCTKDDVNEFRYLHKHNHINKVEFKNFRTDAYIAKRDKYLKSLAHEDDYLIEYSYGGG